MLARRLMGTPGRATAFPAPVAPAQLGAFTLFSAPQGGGVTPPDPKAYHYNGRTFFGWVNGDHGNVELASYDHATQTVSASNAIGDPGGSGDPDDHDQAALIVRESDKRILAAFSRHVGSAMWIRVSPDPESIGGVWPALTNIDSQLGGTGYTYPSLVQLRGVADDPIYLFYRDTTASGSRVCYSVSTDDGATWAAQTVLFDSSTQFVSFRVGSDWDTRIDIVTNDGDAYTAATSLYHFYLNGSTGTLHRSDGTGITGPVTPATATLVHDGADGTGWPAGTILHDGAPRFVYYVKLDASTNSLRRARWTGSAWQVHEITTAGVHPLDRFSTGLSIAHLDPDTVFLGDLVDGTVEVFRYRTTDGGGTWNGEQITTESTDHNAQVQSVHFGVSTLPALWFQGPWTSQHVFDLATMGARP